MIIEPRARRAADGRQAEDGGQEEAGGQEEDGGQEAGGQEAVLSEEESGERDRGAREERIAKQIAKVAARVARELEEEEAARAARDVAGEAEAHRRAVLEHDIPLIAKRVFEAIPNARSMLFVVSQFYADNADDEVHLEHVVSRNERPEWPHRCNRLSPEGEAEVAALRSRMMSDWARKAERAEIRARQLESGDVCPSCSDYDRVLDERLREQLVFAGLSDISIEAFSPYCLEGFSGESERDGFLPFALVTRTDGEPKVALVGTVQRPWALGVDRSQSAKRLGLLGGW